MYYSAYNQMFWGLILIYININIGPVDILPNFIGYIMVYSALGKLSAQHNIYNKGRIPALLMVFASIAELIKVGNINLFTSSMQSQQIWITMLQQIPTAVNIYMVFCICRGFYRVAEDMGFNGTKELVRARWRFFLFTSAAGLYITPFMFNLPEGWSPILFIVLLVNFIAALLFIALVHRARSNLSGGEA